MKKKYKRALAAALAAVMIWNTCDWHPQALAGSAVQYIEEVKELSDEILHQEVPYGTKYKDLELPDKLKVRVLAEEAPDEEDSAEDKDGAEKIATPSELQSGDGEVETEKRSQTLSSSETDGTVRKASPSEADVIEKLEIGEDDTEQKASPSDADGTKTDKNWKEIKVRWVLDETFSEKDTYDGKTPGIYVFDAELKSSRYELDTGFLPRIEVTVLPEEKGPAIIGFSELDEAVAVQKLPLGAKESDIVLPDTLEVELEEADETLAEDSQNVHLVEAVDKVTEKDTEAETAVWQISGITWKLDEEQSDLSEFHGGISEKDYFEEFDEDGEPIETSDKTWNGYYEANQDYNGCAYVYTPVLPEEYPVGEEAELPEICVLVGEMQLMTLAGGEYNLNNNYLNINSDNRNDLNGKTITGSYCPSTRPRDYLDIKGGITIDNVTVDLTIKGVTIKSGGNGASGWDLAGIYLKGNARLNLTIEGDNTLLGLEHGAGIEVEKGATLVITEQSTGSLRAVGGAYGAAGIGGNADAVSYFHGALETKDFDGTKYGTGTIIIKGGTIAAEGGVYWVSGVTDYQGGAGIGTGSYGIGGTIKILGGTINAEGGKQTGAGIGGGMSGRVDTIVIGGANGKAPDITVSSYNSAWGYLGAAIGSGWNGVSDLKLSCGEIQILSGSVKVKGGNIGYGVLRDVNGNSMKGGSITISEKVQLELPLESKIAPRGECTYGKKTFRITAYDNQLLDGTYQADISLYQENDTEKATPVYQTKAEMTVLGFRGTISDITQWIGHSGNMQMVVELKPTGGGTGKTMEGKVVLNKGIDEIISVALGKTAYQKTMDLTIHDGRLKNDKNYTLTVQLGEEASEGGTAPDVVTYSSKKASGYQIKTSKVSWYTPLSGEVPVSVQVQEEGGEGESNSFTVTGTLTMKSEKETNLSLTIGEPLYPVRFHFYSSKVQAVENVSLTVGRLAGAASETLVELKQDKGQFAFDEKLTIDAAAGNHAYALAYLPAGNYRFVINTGIAELGGSSGSFTLDSETVKAEVAGTDITVLNEAEALEGELDLSLGNISFSGADGKLTILYSKTDDSGQVVTAKLIDQSYDKCYRITSSGNTVEKYHLSVNTPASSELKLVFNNLTITPAQAIAPIQINGESHVTTYLEGENKISINQSGEKVSPAGISVAKDAKLTIDSEPEQQGSIEVLNNTGVKGTGAAIGGNGGEDAGTIHIKGGTVIATSDSNGAAIGASARNSVKEIRISGGTITAETKSNGAGIGTGSAFGKKRTGKIVIAGGTVNASSLSGAGIGSGYGYTPGDPAITAKIEIHGGMITAYSGQGACIGSGKDSSSEVLIDGGTICLDNKGVWSRNAAHIGKGEESSTKAPTDVKIMGGTIHLINAGAYIKSPMIYGWEKTADGAWQKNTPKDGNGTPVYYTTADLTGIHEKDAPVETAKLEDISYGFQDVRTDSNGKLYMYLPASETVKASFGGVEFTGKVEAGKDENVLERELTSVDYGKELLKNNLQSAVEFAQSKDASSWTEIPVNGAVSLTEILDSQPEGTNEISLYVRKKADTSGAATEIKIPARPPKPAQITDVTKGSYSIKVNGQFDSSYEYGIAESESGEPEWWTTKTFTSPKPANTYYVTLRVKATDSSFASKPADRLEVTTPDALLIDGPAGAVSFEAKGTYGQTLAQIQVRLAEKFKVVNYGRTEVSGNWHFIERQGGMSASSIYPEVKGSTAYQVEFIPDKASEGQYGEPLTQSVTPEISPKELTAVITTPIVKDYDRSTDIALEATVEIETPGQSTGHSYNIRDLKGRFADANAGTDKTVTIDSSEAKVETGESAVNLQNYRIIYPAQTGTIRPIQGLVSIDQKAWTGEKTYGDDSFPLTGVNVVGDGARNYTSSNEKVLTVDAQGQVTIKGPGSADVSITMENGRNYLGTNTPAEGTITIEKGTLALTLTAVNRTTGAQLSKGILGTEEEDFDIIARVQGVYQDKLQGYVRFYDNENPDAVIVPVGEDGTAVLKWTKPGESLVGTHTIKAEFDFGEFNTWESRYNTPDPASVTFEISKTAPPAEDKPDDSDKPDNSDKPGQSGSQSSSSGRDKSSGSGVTRQDPVKGRTNSTIGILTGTANSTANDGKSHWMQDEHGWWLRFADSSYPKAEKRGTNGIAYAWEQVNGNWWAFDESGYIKTGWMRDEDYGGWFYLDPEHGMQTGWVLIDGKWHYFHPTSDGRKGILYVGRLTPDGYYVDENGVWDGENKPTQEGNT